FPQPPTRSTWLQSDPWAPSKFGKISPDFARYTIILEGPKSWAARERTRATTREETTDEHPANQRHCAGDRSIQRHRRGLCRSSGAPWLRSDSGGPQQGATRDPGAAAFPRHGPDGGDGRGQSY